MIIFSLILSDGAEKDHVKAETLLKEGSSSSYQLTRSLLRCVAQIPHLAQKAEKTGSSYLSGFCFLPSFSFDYKDKIEHAFRLTESFFLDI
jgi:hypothetical protein